MAELANSRYATQAATLLTYYGFDLHDQTVHDVVNEWLQNYQAGWIHSAIVEALYQGRYKGISVQQILSLWSRRGQPLRHFNHEFEMIICRALPYPDAAFLPSTVQSAPPASTASTPASTQPSPQTAVPNQPNPTSAETADYSLAYSSPTESTPSAWQDEDLNSEGDIIASSTSSTPESAYQSGDQSGNQSEAHSEAHPAFGAPDVSRPIESSNADDEELDSSASPTSQPFDASDAASLQEPASSPFSTPPAANERTLPRWTQPASPVGHPGTPEPIHRFVPDAQLVGSHAKLKAVVHPQRSLRLSPPEQN